MEKLSSCVEELEHNIFVFTTYKYREYCCTYVSVLIQAPFTITKYNTLKLSHNIYNTLNNSKIPLIRLAWDWTGAELSDIPDYRTLCILT